MLAQSAATALHFFWLYLFVVRWEYEVRGLGIATTLTYMSMLTAIEMYSNNCLPRIKESIFCPGWESCKNWCEYFKLGIPAAVMLCAEFWAFELMVFLAGVLGV